MWTMDRVSALGCFSKTTGTISTRCVLVVVSIQHPSRRLRVILPVDLTTGTMPVAALLVVVVTQERWLRLGRIRQPGSEPPPDVLRVDVEGQAQPLEAVEVVVLTLLRVVLLPDPRSCLLEKLLRFLLLPVRIALEVLNAFLDDGIHELLLVLPAMILGSSYHLAR